MSNKIYGIISVTALVIMIYIIVQDVGFIRSDNLTSGEVVYSRQLPNELLNTYDIKVRYYVPNGKTRVLSSNYYIRHGEAPKQVTIKYIDLMGFHAKIVGQDDTTYRKIALHILLALLLTIFSVGFINADFLIRFVPVKWLRKLTG